MCTSDDRSAAISAIQTVLGHVPEELQSRLVTAIAAAEAAFADPNPQLRSKARFHMKDAYQAAHEVGNAWELREPRDVCRLVALLAELASEPTKAPCGEGGALRGIVSDVRIISRKREIPEPSDW